MAAGVALGRCLAAALRGEGVSCEGLPPGADLNDLASAAATHRVAPLVLQALRDTREAVPSEVQRALRPAVERVARRNLRRWRSLARVLGLLSEHAVPVIVLKGACLAETIYGNIGLRPMRDVDLLVPRDRVKRVDELLVGQGYASGAWNGPYYEDAHYHFVYMDADGAGTEIHWHIAPPGPARRIALDGLWQRARVATIAGQPAMVFSLEDLLLHLAIHLAMHDVGLGLLGICDIDAVIRRQRPGIDWDVVFTRAGEWGALHALHLALWLAHELLATPVPDAVLDGRVLPAVPAPIADAAVRQVLTVTATTPPEEKNPSLRRLEAASSLTGKLGVVARKVFAPRAMVGQRYGIDSRSPWIWPAYARRVVDLAGEHGREIVRRVRRGPASAGKARDVETLVGWLGEQ